ncbi:MAG: toll/interleukin-1 receptor domain-containing protein [Bacteroidota bacterium]
MPKIFVSYRRDDEPTVTGRLIDYLRTFYGEGNILHDIDSIPKGIDYKEFIEKSMQEIDLMLVIIGEKWINMKSKKNNIKLFEEDDIVRTEIIEAKTKKRKILPVLVGNAQMPDKHSLPSDLKFLSTINACRLREDPDFRQDAKNLKSDIKKLLNIRQRPLPDRKLAIIIILLLLILTFTIVVTYYFEENNIYDEYGEKVEETLNANPIIPLQSSINIGDFGYIEGYVFYQVGNISNNLRLKIENGNPLRIEAFSEQVKMESKNIGESKLSGYGFDKDMSGVLYMLPKKGSYVLRVPTLKYQSIYNLREVLKYIENNVEKLNWEKDYVLVHTVFSAHDGTVIISKSDNAKLAFENSVDSISTSDREIKLVYSEGIVEPPIIQKDSFNIFYQFISLP